MAPRTYSLQEVLALKGIHFPIKERYTEREFLSLKRHLSSREGACMVYDREPRDVVRWMNSRLRKHNMFWVQGTRSWAKIVRLDDSKPLPDDYYEIAEKIWFDSSDVFEKLVDKGRISKDWFGGVTFEVKK